jgi:hypothetical protein
MAWRDSCSIRPEFDGIRLSTPSASKALDQSRAALGHDQLEHAYAQGMTLSIEQAIDLALSQRLAQADLSRTKCAAP